MLHKKGRCDHPDAVVHPPRRPQLAHPRVDDRIAGLPLGPRGKIYIGLFAAAPVECFKFSTCAARSVVGKLVDRIGCIIAPADFSQERFAFCADPLRDMMPNCRRRNLSEMQMRRQARCARLRRHIARAIIIGNVIEKAAQRTVRARLSRRPDVEPGRPIWTGRQQAPVCQCIAARRRAFDTFGGGQRLGRWHPVQQCAPIGRENLVAPAATRADGVRMREIIAVVQNQVFAQLAVDTLPPGFVKPRRVNGLCAGFGLQRLQFGHAVAAAQHQRRAMLAERLRQRGQAVMQPPALRTADGMRTRRAIVEDIHRQHFAISRSRNQRAIVGQAKVLPEPEDRRFGDHNSRLAHRRSSDKLQSKQPESVSIVAACRAAIVMTSSP